MPYLQKRQAMTREETTAQKNFLSATNVDYKLSDEIRLFLFLGSYTDLIVLVV